MRAAGKGGGVTRRVRARHVTARLHARPAVTAGGVMARHGVPIETAGLNGGTGSGADTVTAAVSRRRLSSASVLAGATRPVQQLATATSRAASSRLRKCSARPYHTDLLFLVLRSLQPYHTRSVQC